MFRNKSAFQPAMLQLFDHTNALGGSKEAERSIAVAAWSSGNPNLRLSMAFDQRYGQEESNISSTSMIKRFPVPLDLLPLHPAASAAQSTASPTPLSSLTRTSNNSVPGPSKDQDVATVACSRGASPRGIDMNQLPSSDYDEADVSSPNSILSPFHSLEAASAVPKPGAANNAAHNKRERESFTEFDQEVADRGFEATSLASDEEDGSMPRKKLRLSKEQSALLEESFKEHSTLNPKQKSALAKQLNLRPRQVEVWFQNRRARTKLKQTEVDCELLKRCCDSLTEENRRLQKELQELRAIKLPPPFIIAPDFFMPFPAATLSMCPSCERVAPLQDTPRSSATSLQLHHLPKHAPLPPAPAVPPSFPLFPKAAAAPTL